MKEIIIENLINIVSIIVPVFIIMLILWRQIEEHGVSVLKSLAIVLFVTVIEPVGRLYFLDISNYEDIQQKIENREVMKSLDKIGYLNFWDPDEYMNEQDLEIWHTLKNEGKVR